MPDVSSTDALLASSQETAIIEYSVASANRRTPVLKPKTVRNFDEIN